MDKIIALGFEYTACYRQAGYDVEYCGFPIYEDEHAESNTSGNKRVYCYHGITRKGFKGTDRLLALMEANGCWGLEKLVTNFKIPLSKFIENLKLSQVYVDQWSSFGPAMSALQALQYCPVVISGVQQDFCDSNYFDECPVLDPLSVERDLYLIDDRLADRDWFVKAKQFLDKAPCTSLVGRSDRKRLIAMLNISNSIKNVNSLPHVYNWSERNRRRGLLLENAARIDAICKSW